MTIVHWGVYRVLDRDVRLHPDASSRKTNATKSRFFIVVTNFDVCVDPAWDYIVGVPTSTKWANDFDIELPVGICGTNQRSYARVSAVQPMDKTLLSNRVGTVDGELRVEISDSLVQLTVGY